MQLEDAYEKLLDATSAFVVSEQRELAAGYADVEPADLQVGGYVLVSYPVRPPSKLSCRWGGPYLLVSRDKNACLVRDLTSDKEKEVDASRLKKFVVAPGMDVQAVVVVLLLLLISGKTSWMKC